MPRLLCQNGDTTHESAANTKNMNVHERGG
jgi:hypothetical protein